MSLSGGGEVAAAFGQNQFLKEDEERGILEFVCLFVNKQTDNMLTKSTSGRQKYLRIYARMRRSSEGLDH